MAADRVELTEASVAAIGVAVGGGSPSSSALYDGTQNATTTPAALNGGTTQACSSVIVQADPANTQNIKIGNATSQSIVLAAGDTYAVAVDNVNKVYAKSVSGTQVVNWNARS